MRTRARRRQALPRTSSFASGSDSLAPTSLSRRLEAVEQSARARAGERLEPVWLTFLDSVLRDAAAGAEILRFFLQFAVPAVLVVLADVEVRADAFERAQLRFAGLPEVTGECRRRDEVLRMLRRDVHRRDAAVRRACGV